MPHVLTAPTPPPAGSSTPLRSVAAGTRNETAPRRLGPARRATVARSLRSLRPHHSRIPHRAIHSGPGGSAARACPKEPSPRGRRSERCNSRSGDRHDHHRHHRSARTFRNSSSLRARSALRRDARARRVRHPGRLGRRRRHRGGERVLPHPRPGRRTGRHPARRRTREPALGFRQHARQPRPSVSTAPPTS